MTHGRDPGPRVFTADLTRFTTAGYGTIHDSDAGGLAVGQRIAVTDEGADTVEAEVLRVRGRDAADVRVRWESVLRRA